MLKSDGPVRSVVHRVVLGEDVDPAELDSGDDLGALLVQVPNQVYAPDPWPILSA